MGVAAVQIIVAVVVPTAVVVSPVGIPAHGRGELHVKEILSIAVPVDVPPLPSFCQVKIRRTVVPAKLFGNVMVTRVYANGD